jgi:hypothetical protein
MRRRWDCPMGDLFGRRGRDRPHQSLILHHPHRNRQRFLTLSGLGWFSHLILPRECRVAKGKIARVAIGRGILVRRLAFDHQHLLGWGSHSDQGQKGSIDQNEDSGTWILQLFRSGHRCPHLLLRLTEETEEQMAKPSTLRVHWAQ